MSASIPQTPSSASGCYREPVFDKQKHIRYWLRCFKTLLPTHYESTDSNRMFLAFMILSSLDILGVLHTSKISLEERAAAVDWIYACQHPRGGFRGFPGTDFGAEHARSDAGNLHLDPANIAGTTFALASLVVLRDDLGRVEQGKCVRWLKSLQAEDGSFAEVLGGDGKPEGKRDVRHSYFAVATRYVLESLGSILPEAELDKERLVGSIYETQNYDGGIGGTPGSESHGGYAYCALGALKLLGKLDEKQTAMSKPDRRASRFVEQLVPNLAWRQIAWEDIDSDDEDNDEDQVDAQAEQQKTTADGADGSGENTPRETDKRIDMRWVGFDGRCNKPADTCYTFWVGGTLSVLGLSDALIDPLPHRRFLLERTEHRIGGYGKTPGDSPDALHSFMGLLALSIMHEEELEPVDATFAITQKARDHLEELRKQHLKDR